ncbi:MAG: UPF0758 family protein [Firmicutes bacterium]|nr:UPF0758 family protein [Bacillota bacterium]
MTRVNFYSLRLVKEDGGLYDVPELNCPQAVHKAAREILLLHEKPEEHFCIICLNAKNRIAGVHTIAIGCLNSAIVHLWEVYKAAVLNNANSIILLHNHPSGDINPSQEDIKTTKRLVEAGEIMGINVLDHLIIGDDGYMSFREGGLMGARWAGRSC